MAQTQNTSWDADTSQEANKNMSQDHQQIKSKTCPTARQTLKKYDQKNMIRLYILYIRLNSTTQYFPAEISKAFLQKQLHIRALLPDQWRPKQELSASQRTSLWHPSDKEHKTAACDWNGVSTVKSTIEIKNLRN